MIFIFLYYNNEMESFNLSNALENYIVGQKRTGKNKQFVFLCGDYVIKGPFTQGPFTQGRFDNVINRSKILEQWKSPVAILAIESFTVPDGTFIKYPNFMKDYELESEEHTESFSDYKYNIVKNQPVLTLGQCLTTSTCSARNALPDKWIFDNFEDTLLSLCHCNILSVGDMNVRNIMVDPNTKQFYLIDFDDNLSSDRDDEMFYFNKLPAKKHNFYDNVKLHYNAVADRLIPLLNDEIIINNNLTDRVERIMRLLRQYGINNPVLKPILILPSPNKIKLSLSPNPSIIKPLTPKIITGDVSINNRPIIKHPSPKPNGQMQWKGLLGGSKTYSGIDLDIVKSALQKYMRRNMLDKALMSCAEFYKFSEIPEAKAAVTNLYNRVSIAANEDIGPANVDLVLEVTRLINSENRDVDILFSIVKLMCESKKTRLPSHCWRTYANPEGREVAKQHGLPIDTEFSEEDMLFINEHMNDDIFVKSDPENIRYYILMFWNRLIKRDFNCFTWVSYYMDVSKNLMLAKRNKFIINNPRCKTGKPDILIWKVLGKFLPNQTHDILCEAYFNHAESRPFLQFGIIIVLYNLPYNKITIDADKTINVHNLLKCEIPLVVDDFVIDKHTKQGKISGKTVHDFVNDGSIVIPEDMTYHDELLTKLYQIR